MYGWRRRVVSKYTYRIDKIKDYGKRQTVHTELCMYPCCQLPPVLRLLASCACAAVLSQGDIRVLVYDYRSLTQLLYGELSLRHTVLLISH